MMAVDDGVDVDVDGVVVVLDSKSDDVVVVLCDGVVVDDLQPLLQNCFTENNNRVRCCTRSPQRPARDAGEQLSLIYEHVIRITTTELSEQS